MESKILFSLEIASAGSGEWSSTTYSPSAGKKVDMKIQMHTKEDNDTLLEAPTADCATFVKLNSIRLASGTNLPAGTVVEIGTYPMTSTDVLHFGMETFGTNSACFVVVGVETDE